jgi:anti-sigma factor RsiW
MSASRSITEDDLHAFVDNALDPIRRSEVQRYLNTHPDVARKVDSLSAQRNALREALAPIASEPIPPQLDIAGIVETQRRSRQTMWRSIAASITFLALGILVGWFANDLTDPPRAGIAALAQEAAASYRVYAPDGLRPVEFGPADTGELLQWVSNRLQHPLAVPDLAKSGYRFIGGRLVATPHGPAALFLYDDDHGTRIAMLVRPMAVEKNEPMSEHTDGAVAGYAWSKEGMGYSLVAAAPTRTLHPLANEIRRQINPDT